MENQFIPSEYKELTIDSIELIDEELEMYDIEVEDDHTFCITENNIIVHNCSSMLRAVTMQAKVTNCALLILAQQYANPNALFAQKIQNIRGGKAVYYQPSLIIQASRRLEKADEADEDGFYGSAVIKYFTIKTRNEVRPFLETEVVLDFKNGFKGNEYYGLITPAIQLGFIQCPKKGYYIVPSYSEKMLRLKDLIGGPKAKEVWDTFIEEFDKKSQEQISYSSLSSDIDEIQYKEEFENLSGGTEDNKELE